MKVVLELQDQPSNVRRVTVRHDIVIGRGSDCNLRLSSPQVSRRHCFLRVGREGVSVTDLDSSNGTYVDTKRIKSGIRQELSNGSVLSLGPIRFIVRVSEDAVAADVLKANTKQDGVNTKTANAASDSSTVVSSASALISGQTAAARAMDMDVEQAGAAYESHDATADFDNGDESPVRASNRKFMPTPESMDSRAEIVELGRLIRERDSKGDVDLPSPAENLQKVADESAAVASSSAGLKSVQDAVAPQDAVIPDDVEDVSFFDYDAVEDIQPTSKSDGENIVEDVVEIEDVEVEEVVDVVDVDVVEEAEVGVDAVALADVEIVEEVVDVAEVEVAEIVDADEIVDVAEVVDDESIDDSDEVVDEFSATRPGGDVAVEVIDEVEEFDFFDDPAVEVLGSEPPSDDVPKNGLLDGGRNATFFPAEMLSAELPEGPGFGTARVQEHFEGVFDDPELLDHSEATDGLNEVIGTAWPTSPAEESQPEQSGSVDAPVVFAHSVNDSAVEEEVEEAALVEELSELDDVPVELVEEESDPAEPLAGGDDFDWLAEEEAEFVEASVSDEPGEVVEDAQDVAVEDSEVVDVEMVEDIVEDVETVEPVNIVSENENDGQLDWFGSNSDSSANDDDDIDPELQKFLKGF